MLIHFDKLNVADVMKTRMTFWSWLLIFITPCLVHNTVPYYSFDELSVFNYTTTTIITKKKESHLCHRYNNDVIFSRRHPLIRGIFIKPSLVHFFSQLSGFLSVFKKRIQWHLKKNVIHKLIYAIKRLYDGDGVPTGHIGSTSSGWVDMTFRYRRRVITSK